MKTRFHDRSEAGWLLAEKLREFEDREDVLVLALPRGGVPVAAEVATRLSAPMDVFMVRKLGLPSHPELAMGAIASGGSTVLNKKVIERFGVPHSVIESVAARERKELLRRARAYRDDRPPPDISGKTIILVDDGIATGATMTAAVSALRQEHASKIIVATPVVSGQVLDQMHAACHKVVTVLAPEELGSVGEWYENFEQVTDQEVRKILGEFQHPAPIPR